MIYAILIIAVGILLAICILQNIEIKNIAGQLKKFVNADTNSLVKSSLGTADKLIIQINVLLKEIHDVRSEYTHKQHTIEQMITNISHDLRTPLTSAMGYIDLIQHSEIPEEEKIRELEIIEKRLIRLEELINSFFEVSQIISSGKEPEKSELNLVSVLEEAIVHYYDDYASHNRQIILDCSQYKLMLYSNYNMLMRIFDNLIGNALKHSDSDLKIKISTGEKIRIEFENKVECTDIDISRIFEEFYTVDTSRTKGSTGLGLAIAKQFMEMLGGQIEANIVGTAFVLFLEFEQ